MNGVKITVLLVGVLFFAASAFPAGKGVGEAFSDAIIQRYQPTIDAVTHHGWDHSNSVVLHGMEKVYKNTGKKAYVTYIKRYADTFINADGSITGLLTTLDGINPGVNCLFLYEETGDKKYLKAAQNMRDYLLGEKSPFNKTPDGAYWHKNNSKYTNVSSVDGLYMVQPFLTRYGVIANDAQAIDTAVEQILLVSERSFNIKFNLPFHAWNYDKTKPWANPITGTSSQFWSRASGWYAMALVDVLAVLPKEHPGYSKIVYLYKNLAKGLKAVQNPANGYWYQVLDAAGKKDNYPEASSTGMIVYALQKGVDLKILDKSYSSVAQKGWQALQANITTYKDGGPQINSVAPGMGSQNSYEDYVAIRPISIPAPEGKQHMHGYMAILMAASVMEK